jgi:cell division protease FtsH
MLLFAFLALAVLVSAGVCFRPAFRDGTFRFFGRHKFLFTALTAVVVIAFAALGAQGISAMMPMALSMGVQLLFAIFFMFIQFGAMMYFMSRPRMYWLSPGEIKWRFSDYKGNPEVLTRATRAVQVLRGVKDFRDMGGEITRGILLEGPPGTGKSYLAQVIAGEAGVPFAYCSSASLQSAFMGMGAMTIWRLYRKARKQAKEYGACIIFLDEIDAIGQSRGGQNGMPNMGMGGMFMGGGSGILNELLMQMDPPSMDKSWKDKFLRAIGFGKTKAERPAILTMGATNLVSTLDAALLRPGRFDETIQVNLPSPEGREEILRYYLGKVKNNLTDKEIGDLKFYTTGYSPVAIKHIINGGVAESHFGGRKVVTLADIMKAAANHESGIPQPLNMNDEDSKRVAWHEGGHFAVVDLWHKHLRPARITIVARTGSLGHVLGKPKGEFYTKTYEECLADLDWGLASRAVEEEILGIRMNGFSGDLAGATQMAANMIMQYGMGDQLLSLGALGVAPSDPRVVAQIDKLLRERMRVVKVLVNAVRPGIDALVERLLVEKELEGADASETFHKALEAAGVKVPTPEEALAVVEAEDAAKPKEETPSDAAIDAILKAVKAQQTKA